MNQVKIAYVCNQKKDCGRFERCQVECFHTFNGCFAKNGIIRDSKELESPRFRKVVTSDEVTYYEEVLEL